MLSLVKTYVHNLDANLEINFIIFNSGRGG